MTTHGKTLLLTTIAAAAAVAALLAWAHGWRYWPAPLVIPIVALFASAAGHNRQAAMGEPAIEPPTPPAAAQHFREAFDRDTAVANVPVPSASANYGFLLSATIHWRPSPTAPHGVTSANPGTLASNAIIDRATKQSAIEDPADYVQAQHRLAALLAIVQDDPSESLKVWATDVTLSMRPDDLHRLRSLDELNKQRELWEHQRTIEREVTAYFGQEVLKNPGSAVAWWMAQRHERKHEEIERAVDLIGPLARLAAAANNEEVPEPFRRLIEPPSALPGPEAFGEPVHHQGTEYLGDGESWADTVGPPTGPRAQDHVSGLIEQLGFAPRSEEQARAARLLANLCEDAGNHEAAAHVREAFNVMDLNGVAPAATAGYDDHGRPGDTG